MVKLPYKPSCADDLSGIFVRGIAEGCAAALDGRIKIHDQIVAVCKNVEHYLMKCMQIVRAYICCNLLHCHNKSNNNTSW